MLVNVSTQSRCIVTQLTPALPVGGMFATNVTIQCNCSDGDTALQPIRWFDPARHILNDTAHRSYVPGTPYFDRIPDDTNVVLVIPTLSDSYAGTYTCLVENVRYPPRLPNATVTLTTGK